jgi:hypothetical protein
MNWLIEDFHADLGYKALAYEAIKQGHQVKVLTLKDLYVEDIMPFPRGERTLFQGSCNMARTLKHKNYWKPTVWLNEDAYDCRNYYPVFKNVLFNDRYQLLLYNELIDTAKQVWDTLAKDDCIFIRPCSGMKSFTGTVETLVEFNESRKWRDNFVSGGDMLLVSSPKNILREWRLVTDNTIILASSQYKCGGRNDVQQGCPLNVIEMGHNILEYNYRPDPMWCLDICEDEDGHLWLLEIGSFSCASLYACDMEHIVRRVNELVNL